MKSRVHPKYKTKYRVSNWAAYDRALVQRPCPSSRDRTIIRVKEIGRRRWKKESGYPQQARVENTFFRYKTIIGGRVPALLAERLRLRRRGSELVIWSHRKLRRSSPATS
jgi:hypothetical protein